MIGRVAAGGVAAVPVVWQFFGYHFSAGPMIVGLCACLMVRLYATFDAPGQKRWLIEGLVTGIALLTTAVWIAEQQVDLFAALGTGIGLGAVGAGIITMFKRRAKAALDAIEVVTGGTPDRPGLPADIAAPLRQLDQID